MFPYQKNDRACIEEPIKETDLVYKPVGAVLPTEYNLFKELKIPVKVNDQKRSLSCVGHAFSKYAEILNWIETSRYVSLSAKFIYSRIFDSVYGGSRASDAVKILSNLGVCEEELDPNPDTEQEYRIINNSQDVLDNALIYRAKAGAVIWHRENVNVLKEAIFLNKGVCIGLYGDNIGWSSYRIKPNKIDWSHMIYCYGWNSNNEILFINSWSDRWGDRGCGVIDNSYWHKGLIFQAYTLIDIPNNMNKLTIEQLNKLSQLVFHRDKDLQMDNYLPYDFDFIADEWFKSEEWKKIDKMIKILKMFGVI